MDKFSVLLSVYKKENPRHFSEALHSIWSSQTLKPDEIVLVKDGHLTEVLDAEIEKWKSKLGETLTIVALKKQLGLGNALGIGLNACSHDLVARMDTDDIAYPHRFQKQIDFLEQNPGVDIVGSTVTEFQDIPTASTSTRKVPLHHEQILQFAKTRSPFNHPSVMFKKDAVLKAGNYRKLLYAQDYDLWVRMLLNGTIAANMEEPLVSMRGGMSMLKRKRGCRYALNEYRLQKTFYEIGFLSSREFLRNLLIRIPVRLLPTITLKLVYRLIRAQRVP